MQKRSLFLNRGRVDTMFFADFSPPQPLSHAEADVDSEKIVMMDALNHALDEEMSSDSHVVVFGQDVAHGKGVSLASPAV